MKVVTFGIPNSNNDTSQAKSWNSEHQIAGGFTGAHSRDLQKLNGKFLGRL